MVLLLVTLFLITHESCYAVTLVIKDGSHYVCGAHSIKNQTQTLYERWTNSP